MGKLIIEKPEEGYIIRESNQGFLLCKVVSVHKTKDEALKEMLRIMNDNK